jgi:hypothetical protein
LPFKDVKIDTPFSHLLLNYPQFMAEAGAALLLDNRGRTALIGIGKAVVDKQGPSYLIEAMRKGEIRARTAILEMRDGVEVKTSREVTEASMPGQVEGDTVSLSRCFQITESRVEGLIHQLPVIGTWRACGRSILYVAVGKMVDRPERGITSTDNPPSTLRFQDSDALFASLIRASPALISHGGVQGFQLRDGRKALVGVACTELKGSLANAIRLARVKAMRSILGHTKGIQLSRVERLSDGEMLILKESGTTYEMLSEFISVEKEEVCGYIKSLPVVATWEDTRTRLLYVAIGQLF